MKVIEWRLYTLTQRFVCASNLAYSDIPENQSQGNENKGNPLLNQKNVQTISKCFKNIFYFPTLAFMPIRRLF